MKRRRIGQKRWRKERRAGPSVAQEERKPEDAVVDLYHKTDDTRQRCFLAPPPLVELQ